MRTLEPHHQIVRLANAFRAFFGHPVYLVGSAVNKENTSPRDWDLVCIIPYVEFSIRYDTKRGLHRNDGLLQESIEQWITNLNENMADDFYWNWSDECVKKSLCGSKVTRKYIDFKVWPKSYDDKYHKDSPKLKLDTR